MPLTFANNPKKLNTTHKEPVVLVVDPPNPIVEIKLPHGTPQAKPLREVAKKCRHENWGVWQYDGDSTWWTIHKDSTPTVPKLNCDPLQAINVSKELFLASPACKLYHKTT